MIKILKGKHTYVMTAKVVLSSGCFIEGGCFMIPSKIRNKSLQIYFLDPDRDELYTVPIYS